MSDMFAEHPPQLVASSWLIEKNVYGGSRAVVQMSLRYGPHWSLFMGMYRKDTRYAEDKKEVHSAWLGEMGLVRENVSNKAFV